ncbi:MAG: hypothetical protein ACKVRP_07510 [Bacteroidota bacterium]
MITRKTVNIYGIVGLVLMSALLSLVWLEVVPRTMYLPLFLMAAAIFIGRVVLRIVVARHEQKDPPSHSSPVE